MEERLQKYLAAAGVASRRKAEELIVAGRVKVNERVATELGTKVDPAKDLVTVDGRLVSRREGRSYYMLYKPPGCLTTASDPEGRPTALEYLRNVKERVFPVGRLDWDAEGAVLFTDDGELANRLAHPRYGHRRTYLVKVRGDPAPEALKRMTDGVRLEDGPARALEAVSHEAAEKNVWVRVVVGEGRYHLVKRLCEAVGLQVQRLFRPEFGGVTVEGLRPGQFRPLSDHEVRAMKASVGLDAGGAPAPAPRAFPKAGLPKAARRHGHGPPPPPRERTSEDAGAREASRGRAGAPEQDDRSPRDAGWDRRSGTREEDAGRERRAGSREQDAGRERRAGPREQDAGRERRAGSREPGAGRERRALSPERDVERDRGPRPSERDAPRDRRAGAPEREGGRDRRPRSSERDGGRERRPRSSERDGGRERRPGSSERGGGRDYRRPRSPERDGGRDPRRGASERAGERDRRPGSSERATGRDRRPGGPPRASGGGRGSKRPKPSR